MSIVQQLRDADRYATVAAAELLVLETFARVALPETPARRGDPPSWLIRVRQSLDDRPFDPPATEELAREAGLHPVYVARAFRAWFGCSLASYARLLRLDRAIRLLVETRQPLANIAAMAGFADQSHLTRAVRLRTGLTPRGLRAAQVARVQDFRAALR
jgi:AraC family transcriptional regulator